MSRVSREGGGSSWCVKREISYVHAKENELEWSSVSWTTRLLRHEDQIRDDLAQVRDSSAFASDQKHACQGPNSRSRHAHCLRLL